MTHFRSSRITPDRPRFYAFGLVAVLAVLASSATTIAALVTTDRYIVTEHDVVTEDQYVTASSGQVEGVIDGDLTIFTGSLTIVGEVTGSVTVFSIGGVTVAEGATIGGSLRGTAGSVSVEGAVGGDVFIGAASIVVEPSGDVGRDALGFGGALTVRGDVGRDVRGRMIRTEISGEVGGDVDVATQSLSVTESAVVRGDVLYRSSGEASVDDAARIDGTITRLPAQGNFLYGVILSLATVISFLGFLVAGIVSLWLFRTSSSRAVGVVLKKPFRSLLAGIGIVVVFPIVVLVLAITLVGLPLAAIGVLIGLAAFIIGPVPVVTALGNRVMFNRGGLFGAFVLGAVLWRLGIWLIPWVGAFLYLLALVWGIGAWAMGLAAARRSDATPPELLPAALVASEEIPDDWEPPLAPSPVVLPSAGTAERSDAGGSSDPGSHHPTAPDDDYYSVAFGEPPSDEPTDEEDVAEEAPPAPPEGKASESPTAPDDDYSIAFGESQSDEQTEEEDGAADGSQTRVPPGPAPIEDRASPVPPEEGTSESPTAPDDEPPPSDTDSWGLPSH